MENMSTLLKSMGKGFYQEAKVKKINSVTYFAEKAREAGIGLEGKAWEARQEAAYARYDIGENQRGSLRAQAVSRFAMDSYVVERAYQELGVRLRGAQADTVEKALATSTSASLFPVYIDSQVIAGQLDTSLVSDLVATETAVDQHVVQHTSMTETPSDRQTSRSGELARPTVLTVRTADQPVFLGKFAAELDVSYEVLRLQRLNIVNIYLQRLGAQIGIDETDDLIQVLIAGDGNVGSAVVDTDVEVLNILDYDELIRLFLAFPKGYEMRQAVVNDVNTRTILNMNEFKDPTAGFNFQRTGDMVQPMGAAWHRWTSTGSPGFSTDRILAVDNRYAAAQYTEGGTLTESDKVIDRQFEKVVVSKWTGFGKLDYAATQCLDIS